MNGCKQPNLQILSNDKERYVGVTWLLFLIKHLYSIGVWLGEVQRARTIKTRLKEIG